MKITYDNEGKPCVGKGVFFDRIRRITGYLVGATDRWNDAKLKELEDRVKHTTER